MGDKKGKKDAWPFDKQTFQDNNSKTRLKVNSVLDREPKPISNHINVFQIFPNLFKSFQIYQAFQTSQTLQFLELVQFFMCLLIC